MNSGSRIGVFGGTFDPIHRTHLDIARAAMKHAALDKVLFVISASPPHKRGEVRATPEQRLRMVEAALETEAAFETCALEVQRSGPSYTADTLDELRAAHPGAALFLIVGMDALADLPNWHAPKRILAAAHLLAVARPETTFAADDLPPETYDLVPFDEDALSSTEVRDRLERGEDVSDLLPPAVAAYITEAGVYHAAG